MHEQSLTRDLISKIENLARENDAEKVVKVGVRMGALCHICPEHFREHFTEAARGTLAEGAHLDIRLETDTADPRAQDIILESVDVEEER